MNIEGIPLEELDTRPYRWCVDCEEFILESKFKTHWPCKQDVADYEKKFEDVAI